MTVVPISCQSEGALEIYIEPVLPVPHLVIVGGSPMTHTLAELARALDWRTDLLEHRGLRPRLRGRAVDGRRRHPGARRRGHDRARGRHARPPTWAWSRPAGAGEAVLGYLAERGVPKDQLDRVHAPAGLDLGRTTPRGDGRRHSRGAGAAARVRRPGGPRCPRPARGPRAAEAPSSQLAEAVDPVCGMTVMAGAPRMPLEHDGRTYYFCCAGCRRTFEENPDAYIKAVLK